MLWPGGGEYGGGGDGRGTVSMISISLLEANKQRSRIIKFENLELL
jgi:hypothetical protein